MLVAFRRIEKFVKFEAFGSVQQVQCSQGKLMPGTCTGRPETIFVLLPTILILFLLSSQHFLFIFFFINDCIFFLKNTCYVKILSIYLHQIKSVFIIKGSDFPVKSVAVLSTFYSLLMELWTGRFCHLVKRFYPSNLVKLYTAGWAFGKLGAWQWRCWVPPGFLPIGAPAH